MSEYIKREDAEREVENIRNVNDMFGDATAVGTANQILSRLKHIRAADVVEVVRCKDCKIGGWKVSEIDGKIKGYQCPVHAYIQDDNGYCSNGERKDGDKE